jgi:NADPH2:quinone reductase
MKALLSTAPGPPPTLVFEDRPEPQPGPGEVRIRVAACGINFPDTLIIEDKYQVRPARPFSPGAEISGVIEALGDGVTSVQVGQRVIASSSHGGLAEQVVMPAARCIPMPDGMPFETAAAFTFTYGTSYHALKQRGRLQAGQTLLVLGAAGGVGLAAVEIGKAFGAHVVAAVSSAEKAAMAQAHGADATLIYPAGPFDTDARKALSGQFKQALPPEGAHVIYDPVGGDYAEASLRAIAWEGRYLVVGFPAGIPKLPLNLTLLKGCEVCGVFWGAFVARDPKAHACNVAELMALYAEGKLRPEVSQVYPFERAGEAITALAERRALGKLVVRVSDLD